METKIHNLNELFNESSVKNKTTDTLLSFLGLFRIDNMVRRLSLEKHAGISAATLILTLCLFRINGDSIYSAYTSQFHNLATLGKNCFYRIMDRASMDWRKLLYSVVVRFQTILRKRGATTDTPKCYIIDDSTLEKSGQKIEKVGRVFDHTSSNYVLGYKALVLAICDGISTLPIDFSLHQESGKRGDHGLSAKARKKQVKHKRTIGSPDYQRDIEARSTKPSVAIDMLKRAWKRGIKADYFLADSWFVSEKLIQDVRSIGHGAVQYLGLAKMGNTKYRVNGSRYNANQLITKFERQRGQYSRKYKCKYIAIKGFIGEQPVKLFLVKYRQNSHWNILITSDQSLNFVKTFELYKMRWSIEVLFKETKGYLGLGGYQGTNFNGQIADCTLCFITYIVLALGKRFSEYETMGELFRAQKQELLMLTLWKRILNICEVIFETIAEVFSISIDDIMRNMINSIGDKALQMQRLIRCLMEPNLLENEV